MKKIIIVIIILIVASWVVARQNCGSKVLTVVMYEDVTTGQVYDRAESGCSEFLQRIFL